MKQVFALLLAALMAAPAMANTAPVASDQDEMSNHGNGHRGGNGNGRPGNGGRPRR